MLIKSVEDTNLAGIKNGWETECRVQDHIFRNKKHMDMRGQVVRDTKSSRTLLSPCQPKQAGRDSLMNQQS